MGFVKLEQQGHVGILTIDRQEALNLSTWLFRAFRAS